MDPDRRVDLFISCHDSQNLSAGFTAGKLASETAKSVRQYANNQGFEPFIFFESMTRQGEIADAFLQTRPGGLALFLLTPKFFSNWLCVAVLRAFLKERSESNVNLKLRFVCLDMSKEDILSSPSVKEEVRTLSSFHIREFIPVPSIQVASANLCDVVFSAWECTDGVVSPHDLPTIIGETRFESFLALQRVFTEDDLPAFRSILSLPRDASNVLDAFRMASDRGTVTQYKVKKLYKVISCRSSPTAEEQRRRVKAYERKWVDSCLLNWEDNHRLDLSRFFENKKGGPSQASSSSLPHKGTGNTDANGEEISGIHADKPRETTDVFKSYFDEPPQSGSAVLDFESCDEEGVPVTAEGLLLRKVLELANDNDCHTVFARGKQTSATCGMGGVGKSTALRALCHNREVRKTYSDGICFLEFGQDADDQNVVEQISRCVLEFGGAQLSLEMNELSSLSDVLAKGAAWLRGKTVLLVCDDLWSNANEHGYLHDLARLLRYAPRSRLVISTRDRNIAKSTDDTVEFAPLDVEGDKARKILLANVPGIGGEDVISDQATEDGIRRILRVCAGLPLALAIAGRGLETSVHDSGSISSGIVLYCEHLERNAKLLTVGGLGHYPGLARVIDSSLEQCRKWGMSDEVKQLYERNFDMISMFKGLCVLEKKISLPKPALMHLWDTDDTSTDAVMLQFADCSLASRVSHGLSTRQEFGLRLHDLVLERCQKMAEQERSNWHMRIVDAYRKKLGDDRNCNEDEEAQQIAEEKRNKWHECIFNCFRTQPIDDSSAKDDDEAQQSVPWWDSKDDGYILAHLARHLALGGQASELEHLLCDIRWTMLRMKVGGRLSLKSDFDHLFGVDNYADSGMRRVYKELEQSFPYAQARENALAFYIFAHFTSEERKEAHTARLLSSIDRHFPKPWLQPVTNCNVGVKDPREEWKEVFSNSVEDVIIDWTRERVFVATKHEIILWSTLDRYALWTIRCGTRAITLSRDGRVLVSAYGHHSMRRWNAESGAPIGEAMRGHEGTVLCVALSDDASLIVSGSRDKTVRCWNAQSGAPIGDPLEGHEDQVTCVALSEDGNMILSGSRDSTIRRWDARTGSPIGAPLRGHNRFVSCVAVSADGETIVSGSWDRTIRRWNAHSGDSIGEPLRGHSDAVVCIALSGDGSVIVSGSADNSIHQWDARSGALIGDPLLGNESVVNCIAVSEDGKLIVSGSYDSTMRQWNAQSRVQIREPLRGRDSHVSARGHGSVVHCVALSIDGSVIVSGSRDSTTLLWDARSGTPIGEPLRGHKRAVRCIAVSTDGKVIVSGSSDRRIRRWDAHNGAPIGEPLEGHEDTVTCVSLSEDRNLILSGSRDRTIRCWDARTGSPIGSPLRGHKSDVLCVAVSADGKTIVSGSWDRTIRRWNAQSGDSIGEPLRGHSDTVVCVALSKDERLIVSGSNDKTIRRWDARSGNMIGEPLRGHTDSVIFVAKSRDGRIIVSGSSDKTIRLWNALSGRPIGEPRCRGEDIVDLGASNDRSIAIPWFGDKTILRRDGRSQRSANGSDPSQYCAPTNMECLAVNFERRLVVLGLNNGRASICHAMQ